MVQRILVVAPFDDNWNWLSHHFETTEYSWTFLRGDLLGSGRKALIMHAWRAVRAARSHRDNYSRALASALHCNLHEAELDAAPASCLHL